MMDEVSRILNERPSARRTVAAPGEAVRPDPEAAGFDDAGYLRVNPDVAEAIRRGEYRSGHQHYVEIGFREGRPYGGRPQDARNALLPAPSAALVRGEAARPAACGFESLIVSAAGGLMLIGWLDDAADPLDCIRIVGPSWRVVIDARKIVRLRRPDVEAALGVGPRHAYGLLAFLWTGRGAGLDGPCVVEYWTGAGHARTQAMTPQQTDDVEQRNTLLSYLAGAAFLGNAAVEAMTAVGGGIGEEIVSANRAITGAIIARPHVERFGQRAAVPRGSIVVVLYGKPEFLFLQNALFAGRPSIEEYEFVYVCNSPEIAETLLREARRCDLIYGLQQTVVILPDNAGFGAANNVGVAQARSNRILIVNPDVFPRDAGWARKHTDLIGAVRAEECRLFGVPMYYDDGALMHGGMYFEIDRGLSLAGGAARTTAMVRVEHYGKGAPPDTARFLQPRPVPAIGGAFMSCDRAWYESLGGFTEDYVFGHYEDADLCLKSLGRGAAPFLHDIRLWHLEGKGSTRLPPHEGGAIVNRWLFSSRWAGVIEAQILGRAPSHPLLQPRAPMQAARAAAGAVAALPTPVPASLAAPSATPLAAPTARASAAAAAKPARAARGARR